MGKWFQNKSFSTEKQEQGIKARKGHRGINARKIHRDIKVWKLHRAFGILLAAALVFQTVPFEGIAVSASESSGGGLCEHHRSHTPDCGYKEAEPGHGCTHEHTEDCYRIVEGEDGSTTKELDCHHEHDESCGYRETAEGSPCTFVCGICRGGTDEIPEDKTDDNEINDGGSENQGTENGNETEEPGDGQEECTCEERCTEDSINTDCPVCGAEDASLSDCKGKDTEDSTEDAEENTDQPEDTGLCKHHREHDDACGYLPESEDSEGSPCTYECRICPVEELIAALPDKVTEDNAEDVRAQLDKILALFGELTEDEQEQLDLSRCYELQGALDAANDPMPLATGNVVLTDLGQKISFTVDECGNNCQGHTITQNVQGGVVEAAKILVESGTHNITFSGLNLSSAAVGIMPGGTMNLTLESSNKIATGNNKAGIYVPTGATLVITKESTGSLTVSGNDGAGIGGAYFDPTGETGNFDCGTVVINGGTIAATGSGVCAGIGGAYDDGNQTGGNGGTVTINGGTVTATGGVSNVFGGAGIGGGGATTSSKDSGCGGTLTINGGHVTLAAPCSYGFGKGYGSNPKGPCELTLADASYLTLADGTTLDPKGTYTINGDPTEDMIVVPEDLIYNGKAQELGGKIYIDDTKTGTGTYFERTFTVNASAEGWELQDLGKVVNAGEYTAVFKKGNKEISRKFTVAQSGTQFVEDGAVKTYKDGAECSDFTASDTITVKATPTPIGKAPAPANSAMFAAGFTEPVTGQMAVYVGTTQVSAPVSADTDGSYTMTVPASEVLLAAGGPKTGITLTVKFVGNTSMADGAGTVNVNISAVAKIEKNNAIIGYVGESGLDAAFNNSDYAGATFTLLVNVTRTTTLVIKVNCILDLGGHNITFTGSENVWVQGLVTAMTIRGEGEIISEQSQALVVVGSVTLEGGTFTGNGENFAGVYVNYGTLSVIGENVVIQNTSNGSYGLVVSNAQSVQLSAGTYSGTAGAISIVGRSLTLGDLLPQGGDTRYAYFDESGTNPFTGVLGNKSLTGTVTVRECAHSTIKAEDKGDGTHIIPECPACGKEATAPEAHDWTETTPCTVCGAVAVAKVEKDGATTLVDKTAFLNAFKDSGSSGVTITMLNNVELTREESIRSSCSCTLDLNGHTIRQSAVTPTTFSIGSGSTVTIKDSGTGGKIESSNNTIEVYGGTLSIESGTVSGFYGVRISSGTVSISGGAISGDQCGLLVDGSGSITLSGGLFSGGAAVEVSDDASVTLKDMLATGYAYHQNDMPVAKAEGFVGDDYEEGEVSLDATPAWLTSTVTVKECQHNGEGVCTYTHTSGTTTHQKTCLACGNKCDEENCSFGENGKCACEAVLAVALKDNAELAYTGEAQTPEVNVTVDGIALAAEKYQLSYDNNINAGNTAKVTVTAVGGSFSGSVSTAFTIKKAALTIKANNQAITYGGSITEGTDQVTAAGLCTGDILSGITLTASTGEVPGGDITPYAAQIKNGSNEDVTANYDIVYEAGKLTISYMDSPAVILYNGEAAKGWYNGDVVITADGYTVSDTLGMDYKDSYIISAQEGTVTKTLYFKDAAGHMSGGVEITVKFDLTPPMGEIAVGAKWWQNVLHFISFGNYAVKEYTVTIKAEDKKGSGISKIEYAIVTGSSQYTDADTLAAANLSWTEYNSGSQPTVPVSNSPYVVYARLTDNAGNVTYISTDGILLDNTPPTVGSLSVPEDTRKDVTAGFTFTVSEAADYYYVVLPKDSAAPSAEDIIVTCGGTLPEGTETAISGTFPKGSGAVSADTLPASVSVEAENLSPNTAYTVYVTAVDRAVDISNLAEGTPAGNIAVVQKADFTTKKILPVITKAPAVTGTYGQRIGDMTVAGGTAKDGNTVLAGTWAVSSTDKDKIPSAGTAEVTVIFTPDNDSYDSVSVQASLEVKPRNLGAAGVTVSDVAGDFTYTGSEIQPPVAVNAGTPVSGISVSDSGAALTANDFTVSYSNNKDAGTASVTITGKGNYAGSVTRTFPIGKAPGREVPDVSGSYTDNGQTYTYTVMPTEGAVYRMGNDGKWQEGNVFEGITPGTSVTFYAKILGDKNYEDGTPKSITVDFPKLTPAAPALSYKADRTNQADVKVTITPVSGAEYSFDGGKTWTESNEQGGFAISRTVVLAIRLKETATHNPSPAQAVTVNLAKKDREAPPAFTLSVEANGETDYTVTIPATEGCEYSFDGEHWSDVHGKTGVKVGETVTGYKRYKETDDYNAGSAVSASKTMEKFTVKTPVISPAGGSYAGNVSVTITCASPDAEIYYTTDGSTPGRGSTRYTGAFTVTAPATVKAIAVKEGLTDSAEASVTYTKKSDSGSGSGGNGGGNSGGSGNNGGGDSDDNGNNGGGGSTNPGNGSTTPQIPVIPPAENINPGNEDTPGTGTTPVNPGNGNTARPGTRPGSGSAGTPAQGTKQPFIKGADGKIGWDVIRAEEENAEEGSVINVDMNGSTVVPGDLFDSIKGKDITITFDMGNGILWSVDGKSITTDKAGDIDFSVKSGVKTVPVDIINNVTGESYSIQISLAYEGEFGFTAVISIGLGKENAGYTASLYYYNESTEELEFICAGKVAQDGTVSLAFTHASDYVIAIDGDREEGDSAAESTQPDENDGTGGEAGDKTAENSSVPESPDTGRTGAVWWIILVIILLIAAIGAGVFVAVKKKGEDENGRQ